MSRLLLGLLVALAGELGMWLPPLANAATGSPQQKPQNNKIYGEIRSDAALVYIYSADMGPLRIFCDDQLVGVPRHNNYTFAYIAPGTHVFWTEMPYEPAIADLAVGQTYYLHFNDHMSILSEADGQASLKKASRYRELTQEQRTKAAGAIAKKWPKLKDKLGSKLMLIRLPQHATRCSIEAWAAENQATILAPWAHSTADSTTRTRASTIWSRRGGPTGFVAQSATAATAGG